MESAILLLKNDVYPPLTIGMKALMSLKKTL